MNSAKPITDPPPTTLSGAEPRAVKFTTPQGEPLAGPVLKLGRNQVSFELHNPMLALGTSDALEDFTIEIGSRFVYRGRAVIRQLIETGSATVCDATMPDPGVDPTVFEPAVNSSNATEKFHGFLRDWEKCYRILPEYKVAVGDLHTFFTDARNWMQHAELAAHGSPANDRVERERELAAALTPQFLRATTSLCARFEEIARQVDPDEAYAHHLYSQRHLHPLILASPFIYRTYAKPLGYAGDYEMVNMMLGDRFTGSSLFSRAMNAYALDLPPVVAHRNRLKRLTQRLTEETMRRAHRPEPVEVLSIGCGPAHELQEFLRTSDLSDNLSATLLDFSEEAIDYVGRLMTDVRQRHGRRTRVTTVKRSVQSLLLSAAKSGGPLRAASYDVVYCAGLFDYLPERVCQRLMEYFYTLLRPGGLLLTTNVDDHAARGQMQHFLEWNLIYRDPAAMNRLAPAAAPADEVSVIADSTGVNLFLEIRRPDGN